MIKDLKAMLQKVQATEKQQIDELTNLKLWTMLKLRKKKVLVKHLEKMLKFVHKKPQELTQNMVDTLFVLKKESATGLTKKEKE